MKTVVKNCLYCNTELIGRSDKQFCNTYCKSAYHNNRPNSHENFIRDINKKLRTNRSALRKACPMGNATVRKEFLKTMGMDFKYLTHTWKGKNGQLYFFCYDYGYTQAHDAKKVVIIQEQSFMGKHNLPDPIE